jgi:hypothetical protein
LVVFVEDGVHCASTVRMLGLFQEKNAVVCFAIM